MSTQRLLFVENYKDFMNWSDCVEGINIIGRALYLFMKTEVEEEEGIKPILKDVQLLFDPNHSKKDVIHVDDKSGDKVYMISQSQRCCCTKCMPLFNIIEEKFIQPNNPIYIEDPKAAAEPCSTLLRMCLNDKGKCTQKIRDGDLKTLYKVMERCSLFETPPNIEQVIVYRNALMHSSSNELSDSLKQDYLTTFETLLRDCDTVVTGEAANKVADLKRCKHENEDSSTRELKGSITKQIEAIKNDQQELQLQGYQMPTLDKILEMVKKHKRNVEDVEKLKESKEATLSEAITAGGVEGAKALSNGGYFGEKVGEFTGKAGAGAAGIVKSVADRIDKLRK